MCGGVLSAVKLLTALLIPFTRWRITELRWCKKWVRRHLKLPSRMFERPELCPHGHCEAFNVTHFESRITHFLYTAINYNWTRSSKSVSWIHKKPRVFSTTSWRCPPWQSRHCCHLPGTLVMTRRSVSCVTLIISWRSAFLRLLMSGRVWVKTELSNTPIKNVNSLKNAIRQEIANVTLGTLHSVMASVPGSWQQCLNCHGEHLQNVVLKTWAFLWIQGTDLLDRVQLYLLLWTINVLSYFQNG